MSYVGKKYSYIDEWGRRSTILVINECEDGFIVFRSGEGNFDISLMDEEEFHAYREWAEGPEFPPVEEESA